MAFYFVNNTKGKIAEFDPRRSARVLFMAAPNRPDAH